MKAFYYLGRRLIGATLLGWSLVGFVRAADPVSTSSALPPVPPAPTAPTEAMRQAAQAARAARLQRLATLASNRPAPTSITVSPSLASSAVSRTPSVAVGSSPLAGLAFDAMEKITYVTNGAADAVFAFGVTNVSKEDVTILSVHTSCGCTAAKLPQQPWLLHPGDSGEVGATMHVAGKWGTVTKSVTIVSSLGSHPLMVKSVLPEMNSQAAVRMTERSRNLQIAAADRQAVFRNDCAKCHVEPTVNKHGRELYVAACGVCHDAEHKATMVPTLVGRPGNYDAAYWNQWVRNGKPGSLMPAFEMKQGGPLSDDQVNSLTAYLANEFVLQATISPTDLSVPTTPGPLK